MPPETRRGVLLHEVGVIGSLCSQTWMLGTKLESSVTGVSAFNWWAVSAKTGMNVFALYIS